MEAKVWGVSGKQGLLDLFPGQLCGRFLPSVVTVLALEAAYHEDPVILTLGCIRTDILTMKTTQTRNLKTLCVLQTYI